MAEATEQISEQAIIDLLKTQQGAKTVEMLACRPIEDPFNEVSKMDPPDYAWLVLAEVTQDEETDEMTFQIGEKDGVLRVYCTWDYNAW